MLAASTFQGFEHQSLSERLWQDAQDDLTDARRLAEKIVSFGGEPTLDVAPLRVAGEPHAIVDHLVEIERGRVDTLQDAIAPTGREGRSEALEHRLQHIIMRKQEAIDFLIRALGGPQRTFSAVLRSELYQLSSTCWTSRSGADRPRLSPEPA